MNIRSLFILGSVVSVSPMIELVARFARTVMLSRLLAPTEFGLCVAIMAFVGTVELVSDVSVDKFLVCHSRGGRAVLAAAHQLSLGRGALLALIGRASCRERV